MLVYNSQLAWTRSCRQAWMRMSAVDYIESASAKLVMTRCVWLYPIEVMDVEWEPDPPKPTLKLVH